MGASLNFDGKPLSSPVSGGCSGGRGASFAAYSICHAVSLCPPRGLHLNIGERALPSGSARI